MLGLPASSAAARATDGSADPSWAPPSCVACTADVDGTLIHSVGSRSNYLHKAAFTAAFKEVRWAAVLRWAARPEGTVVAARLAAAVTRLTVLQGSLLSQVFGLDTHIDVVKHHGR